MEDNNEEMKSNQTNLSYNLNIKKFLKIIEESISSSYIPRNVKRLCQ
jgi:hypothetical protein